MIVMCAIKEITEDVMGNDTWDGYSSLGGSERVKVNLMQHLRKDMRDYMKASMERSEGKGNQAKSQR